MPGHACQSAMSDSESVDDTRKRVDLFAAFEANLKSTMARLQTGGQSEDVTDNDGDVRGRPKSPR